MNPVNEAYIRAFIGEEADHFKTETELINEKIGRVYAYVAEGFLITTASSVAFAKLGFAATVISFFSNVTLAPFILCAIGIGIIVKTIFTKKEEASLKHGLFCGFALWEGLVISPLVLINAPVFVAAAATTTLVMGGLGVMANALKEGFERYEKILFVALTALTVISFGSLLLGSPFLHEVCVIGGIALFSAYVIYDTQKVRSQALSPQFDEINHAMGLYLDAMNLLIRIYDIYSRNQK